MREWLRTRGREIVSLLSDLGGALAFVVSAAGLISAAVVGTILVALDVVPQPFFELLVLGVALLAAGVTLHLLRGRLAPPPRPALDPAAARAENPHPQAGVPQRVHDDAEAERESEAKISSRRRALRSIREELLDNRQRVQRAGENDTDRIHELTRDQWTANEDVLLEMPDPEPHAAAREAYREIAGIKGTRYSFNPHLGLWEEKDFPGQLLETDVSTTLEAIDIAAEKLRLAESD